MWPSWSACGWCWSTMRLSHLIYATFTIHDTTDYGCLYCLTWENISMNEMDYGPHDQLHQQYWNPLSAGNIHINVCSFVRLHEDVDGFLLAISRSLKCEQFAQYILIIDSAGRYWTSKTFIRLNYVFRFVFSSRPIEMTTIFFIALLIDIERIRGIFIGWRWESVLVYSRLFIIFPLIMHEMCLVMKRLHSVSDCRASIQSKFNANSHPIKIPNN